MGVQDFGLPPLFILFCPFFSVILSSWTEPEKNEDRKK